jgi:hypothetical protein
MEKRLFIMKQPFDCLAHDPGNGYLVLVSYIEQFGVLFGRQADGKPVRALLRWFLTG